MNDNTFCLKMVDQERNRHQKLFFRYLQDRNAASITVFRSKWQFQEVTRTLVKYFIDYHVFDTAPIISTLF